MHKYTMVYFLIILPLFTQCMQESKSPFLSQKKAQHFPKPFHALATIYTLDEWKNVITDYYNERITSHNISIDASTKNEFINHSLLLLPADIGAIHHNIEVLIAQAIQQKYIKEKHIPCLKQERKNAYQIIMRDFPTEHDAAKTTLLIHDAHEYALHNNPYAELTAAYLANMSHKEQQQYTMYKIPQSQRTYPYEQLSDLYRNTMHQNSWNNNTIKPLHTACETIAYTALEQQITNSTKTSRHK